MLSLPHQHLHLWLCQTSRLDADFLSTAPDLFLDDTEKTRFTRFKFPQHQTAFLASRILLKTALAEYLACDFAAIRFAYGDKGKPQLSADINPAQLQFNLSHSGDFAVLAIHHQAVGIDTENLERQSDILNIARHYFHPREVAQLEANCDNPHLGLYFWMLKEAYIKYTGQGLAQPLREFSFVLDAKLLSFAFDNKPEEQVYGALLQCDPACIAAVCCRGPVSGWQGFALGPRGAVTAAPLKALYQSALSDAALN